MQRKRTRTSDSEDADHIADSDDSKDSDFELQDSDYDVSDGDEDLHGNNVADHETDHETVMQEGNPSGQAGVASGQDGGAAMQGGSASGQDGSASGQDGSASGQAGCAAGSASIKKTRKRSLRSNAGKVKCDVKEENSDEEDLWAPDSDDDTVTIKFKTFRESDLANPKFFVGQVFGSVELLRKAIRAYSCINRKDIKLPINDKARVRATCVKECSWYLWASYDTRTKAFQIKRYTGQHTCSGKWKVYAFTAKFIAEQYLESFRADQDMNLKNLSRIVQKGWNMTPSRSKLQRARRLAMNIIYGDEKEQYMKLWDYANEIRRSNPGSSFYLSLDEQARFKQCYMCLDASKRGFLEGCRPVIFLDGCHIKTRYIGQLLCAVGIDPNDCIFPIALAAVEVEDTVTWTWFLDTVKADLGIVNTTRWTIMSDKRKVNYVTSSITNGCPCIVHY
jgi:hypothetical protein